MLLRTQSFATGGWGPNEALGEPGTGQLGDSLRTTHASFETPCGAYGHFKIARYLLRTTKDAALLRAKPSGSSGDCTATSADGKEVVIRPFMTIKEETYNTYVQVKA